MKQVAWAMVVALGCMGRVGVAQDAPGCKDSPLLERFPGSTIVKCVDKADDAYIFIFPNPKDNKKAEGEYHEVDYTYPATASKAQVVRNMNTALRRAGYIFDRDTGDYGDFNGHIGKTWIAVTVNRDNTYEVFTVKETALSQDVVATAADLSSGLVSNGHAVVNGILFDTGKADVKPESAAALTRWARR